MFVIENKADLHNWPTKSRNIILIMYYYARGFTLEALLLTNSGRQPSIPAVELFDPPTMYLHLGLDRPAYDW